MKQERVSELDAPVCIQLNEQVTIDLFFCDPREHHGTFRFLDREGNYVLKKKDPDTVNSWEQARVLAEDVGAYFIVNFTKRIVLRRGPTRRSASWQEAVIFPHEALLVYRAAPRGPMKERA